MWRMRIASGIPKATNKHLEYVILITLRHCTNAPPQCYVHTYIAFFVLSYVIDKLLTDNLFEGAYSVERLGSFPVLGCSDAASQ